MLSVYCKLLQIDVQAIRAITRTTRSGHAYELSRPLAGNILVGTPDHWSMINIERIIVFKVAISFLFTRITYNSLHQGSVIV
jgi:hypothetical protein